MIIAPALRKSDYFSIRIKHLATQKKTSFEGWVTEFSDKFTSDWNEVAVYGRMDPLVTFRGTKRNISLSFDIVSDNRDRAIENLERVSQLITFLYPVYEQQGGTGDRRVGQTLKAAPLVSLQWTNLISNAFDGYPLVGYLGGVTYNPDVSQGGFVDTKLDTSRRMIKKYVSDEDPRSHIESEGIPGMPLKAAPVGTRVKHATEWMSKSTVPAETAYIPKVLSVSLEFGVLHQHLNGFVETEDGVYSFDGAGTPSPYPNNVKAESYTHDAKVYRHTFTYIDEDGNKIEGIRRREVTQLAIAGHSEILGSEIINEDRIDETRAAVLPPGW